MTSDASGSQQVDGQILRLAIPALGALIAEPLFVLVDTAVVGHLGTASLGGLALASTVLVTVVGLCVFLAYASTASVARLLGAGRRRDAIQSGIDGIWLALALGAVLAIATVTAGPALLRALGGHGDVLSQATIYLQHSAIGLPGMLAVLAATGVLRGLQDTRTPLIVAGAGAVVNAVASVGLVYGAGLGIAGSAWATAGTQLLMGGVLVWLVARAARAEGIALRPHAGGVLLTARTGTPLFIRTLSLRAAILLTVVIATGLGPSELAGHQVVTATWGLAAFALDALAIAAQALIGHSLGAGNLALTRALLRRTLQWGTLVGGGLGLVIAGSSWWFAGIFTADDDARRAAMLGLIVCGVLMPIAGWVFVLDGVLIGAGDGVYLAWAGVGTLLVYVPAAWAVQYLAPSGPAGLAWLWVAFAGVFMLARAVTTGLRARGGKWLTLGVN